MEERYTTRPDAAGYSVIDLETGAPVRLGMAPQVGLSLKDAEHTARQFNLRPALPSYQPAAALTDPGHRAA